MNSINQFLNYVGSSDGKLVKVTDEQREILQNEIDYQQSIIEEQRDSEIAEAQDVRDDEIQAAQDALDEAKEELDAAQEQMELYGYESGFFGLQGKFDFNKDDSLSDQEIQQKYADAYYGVDADGNGEIDADSVHYQSLSYDSVSDEEIETLETLLNKDSDTLTEHDLATIDKIMDKMAKEARKDSINTYNRESVEYNQTQEESEEKITEAQETFDATVADINEQAEEEMARVKTEVKDEAVEGSLRYGTGVYFAALENQQNARENEVVTTTPVTEQVTDQVTEQVTTSVNDKKLHQ